METRSEVTAEKIKQILSEQFSPTELYVEDQSAQHVGHAGAKSGGGHFYVKLTSKTFENLTPLQRSRTVYAALNELFVSKEIHALSLDLNSEKN